MRLLLIVEAHTLGNAIRKSEPRLYAVTRSVSAKVTDSVAVGGVADGEVLAAAARRPGRSGYSCPSSRMVAAQCLASSWALQLGWCMNSPMSFFDAVTVLCAVAASAWRLSIVFATVGICRGGHYLRVVLHAAGPLHR